MIDNYIKISTDGKSVTVKISDKINITEVYRALLIITSYDLDAFEDSIKFISVDEVNEDDIDKIKDELVNAINYYIISELNIYNIAYDIYQDLLIQRDDIRAYDFNYCSQAANNVEQLFESDNITELLNLVDRNKIVNDIKDYFYGDE